MIDILEGAGTVERELPAKHVQFRRYGIDISREPMLVYPTLHYQNGGLRITETAATTVPGLFAAGETTGGVHGENRLMGNSLLDVAVFGRRAGVRASEYVTGLSGNLGPLSMDHVRQYIADLDRLGVQPTRVSPMLLPDYTNPDVRNRQLTAHYHGTIR